MNFHYKHNMYGKTPLRHFNMSFPYRGHSCNTNNSWYHVRHRPNPDTVCCYTHH